jgi:hypothetical protein
MKIAFFIFLIILITPTGYSQNIPTFWNKRYVAVDSFGQNNTPAFTFSEDGRVNGIKNGNPKNGTHDGNYRVIEEDGINYLLIYWDDNTQDKYLIIGTVYGGHFNDFNLYNKDGIPFFNTGTIPNPEYRTSFQYLIPPERISASSQLKEGNIVYSTDNLDYRIGVCWVARGGVGEKIIIRKGDNSLGSLSISTGFISIEKPYLYRQNSRPKIIRISNEGQNSKIVELADTYHVQYMYFDASYKYDVWIEILEVYPGTKYNDTCINFFRYYWSQ